MKTQYIVYNARNFRSGLTDVTANVFKDGVSVAVATGLALAELNPSDAKGRYTLTLTPTQINSFGGVGTYKVAINSASRNAPATAKLVIQANDNDDLSAQLSTISGDLVTIDTKIDALQTDITSVKGTVESTNSEVLDGVTGLAAIKGLIDTAISGIGSIQQTTRTVVGFPTQLVSPSTGTETYEVLINIYNTQGSLEDPDTNLVNVSLQNASGLDRGNLFTGGGASPKAATRLATGKYKIELTVPAGTTHEQINMLVDYTENTIPLQAVRSANIVSSVDASGLAQQVTVQSILDDTSVMQPQVATIQSEIQSATYGLAVLKGALDAIDTVVQSSNNVLLSPTIGNQAILDAIALTASQASVNNVIGDLGLIKGSGFDSAEHSLVKIKEDQFYGGSAQ